jgi:ABC-type transport system involved in multi-copper enzyme maturation permease subunit
MGGPMVAAVMIVLEYGIRQQAGQIADVDPPTGSFVAFFLSAQALSLCVLYVATGCGVVSEDIRHRMLQLYFSKPMSVIDYGAGKFAGLFALGSLLTVLPTVLLAGLRSALYLRSDALWAVLQIGVSAVFLSAVSTFVITSVVLGLSSLIGRTGYVVLAFIGVLLVPIILEAIVGLTAAETTLDGLGSLTGNLDIFARFVLLDDVTVDVTTVLAPLILVAISVLGIWTMIRRVQRLEGVV